MGATLVTRRRTAPSRTRAAARIGAGALIAACVLLSAACSETPVEPGPADRVEPVARPSAVRGVYVNAQVAGDEARLGSLLDQVAGSRINAVVIDVKERGEVSYASRVALVEEAGASRGYIADLRSLLEELRERELYPIARIVVFSDRVLAGARTDWAIQTTAGAVWLDPEGDRPWVDPYNSSVWQYNIDLAREALEAGFAEVQWDYVRFPDVNDSTRATLVFPARAGRTMDDAIEEFIAESKSQLADLGAPVTSDVFGRVITEQDGSDIGQEWSRLVRVNDVLLPMVYPALYHLGAFGIPNPNDAPYETVRAAMDFAVERRGQTAGARATLRPWLQAFSLNGVDYGADQMRAQIEAVEDAGLTEWLFWNPDSVYPDGVF